MRWFLGVLGMIWGMIAGLGAIRLFTDSAGSACGVNNQVGYVTVVLMMITALGCLYAAISIKE